MNIFKFCLIAFFASIVLIVTSGNVFAAQEKSIVLVNPIRGNDFWQNNFSLTQTPVSQYRIIKSHNLPATWLVRYDGLIDPQVQEFLKSLDLSQDVGIFFEVTPTLTEDAGVKYNESGNWHQAKSVLLTGYSPEDRVKLIDTTIGKYKELFSKNPKSVGAWWIDAYSLGYMKDKYGIEANLDVADQYSTDGYQVWGQYWSTPFYPSKSNALMPAQSNGQKLGVVTIQWATRDPLNGYGNGVFESTYSVQANDYMLHDLGIDYFEKLVNIYPQTTVGLENDFDYSKFGKEYEEQIKLISELKQKGGVNVYNMAQFATVYAEKNPGVSPQVLITANDPLGGEGKVIWVMNPRYRAGLFFGNSGVVMRDLRFYNDSNKEECFDKKCDELKLAFSQTSAIDEGNFNSKWVIDESPVIDISTRIDGENIEVKYKTLVGIEKTIIFLPNDLKIEDRVYTIPVAVMNALNSGPAAGEEEKFVSIINYPVIFKDLLFQLIKFLGLVLVFFLIPGLVFSRKIPIAIPVGMVLFTLLAFVLGYLGQLNTIFKTSLWLWLLPVVSLAVKNKHHFDFLKNFKVTKIDSNNWLAVILIVSGSIIWSLATIKNGLPFNYGFGFWGPNGHDAIWHISLISELQKNIPPQNPIFAGVELNNYHYFYDLLVAQSAKLLDINTLDLVFRFFPLILSILSGALIYKLTFKISNSKLAAFWATFFLYFGGSFGWIVSYFRKGDFGGETMFWAQQSISTQLNPPFAISLVLLLAGLCIFYNLKEKYTMPDFWAGVLLLGAMIEFKVYGGVLVLGSLFLVSIENAFKKNFQSLIFFLVTTALSALVFLPNNTGSESLISLMPLWLVNSMIIAQDRLNWYRMTITLQSGVYYKLVYAYVVGTLIFILGNFGTRIIGLISFKEIFKERILSYILIFSIILPLLFIQKGNYWNIVQFLYYGLFVMAIFGGIAMHKIFRKTPKAISTGIAIFIIVLTVPTTFNTLTHYLPARPPAKVSNDEIEALNFLRQQTDGIVLSYPYDEKLKSNFTTPLPLSSYTSTAYVSAFSGKPAFIEDTLNLEILAIDPKARLNIAREIFKNPAKSQELLTQNNIKYVYLFKPLKIQMGEGKTGLKSIYENNEVKILKISN